MSNILVTGASGQLGSELKIIGANYNESFYFADRCNLDITSKDQIEWYVKEHNIDTIINCGAYTDVDMAEVESEEAYKLNSKAVKKLSKIALKYNIKLVHISTDYVFNGRSYRPYIEQQQADPKTVYGKSKLDGELQMIDINPANSIIIRTSWIYSSYGNNFVKTMLKLGKSKDEINVIYDQIGTPTYAKDLAKAILDIVPQIKNDKVQIYHYSNEGVTSWYDFAKEIMRMAKLDCKVKPIEGKDYPTPTPRPHFSLLNKSKIKEEFGITIPYYKDSLDECLRIMKERR